jgi:conjugal transfer pilus assembly protein TraD
VSLRRVTTTGRCALPSARPNTSTVSQTLPLILGTRELADLKSTGRETLREQVLANLSTMIAHRQNVPESAELIAATAGTKAVWVSTQQTEDGLLATGPSGKGSRRRGYEFQVHPSRI